ncbi:hypothetical protein [Flavobacterium sp. Root420]|uniref:hypothetical protein n=1 Tax=Flavobacterium sp. Root420 TaxID=1736533 RepID=UPI0006FBE7F8|nr:hypothetical protein [Flavobacterium sp. Root420]KQW99182.1 hypothetical protein ASC72_08785 [Flavobacterium sp. Root420]
MVTYSTPQKNKTVLLFFSLFLTFLGHAQIGIGTVTPNASSVLDISSTTQGILAPRMTTVQRNAIATPADALLVYDTDVKSFYYYNSATSSWAILSGGTPPRLNFKRIRAGDNLAVVLAAELAAGGGAKYVLTANTLYEINGQIVFNLPIDLNNAYLDGLDANEDIIVKTSGVLFDGTTGGSIRNLTITTPGATVFNLNAASSTATFLLRDTIIANATSVGTVAGYGLVFLSIVNFSGNTNGITYSNIGQLLLSNQAWFSNNAGTYEKFTGTFNLIEKQGGFSNVGTGAFGVDVSTSGLTITSDAVLESVVFTGPTPANYVKPYTTGTYTGYNFNNSWSVRAAGIPNEADAYAVGDLAIDYAVGTGIGVSFTNNLNPSNTVRVGTGTTVSTASNLFRFSTDGVPYRLKYLGKKKRIFQVIGSISFQVPAAGIYIIYIAKNGTIISESKIYGRGAAAQDIVVLPLNASAELTTNDYIEVFAQRYSGGNGDIIVPNMNLIVK